jgi:hypothetical protein
MRGTSRQVGQRFFHPLWTTLGLVLGSVLLPAVAQTTGSVATLSQPARIPVRIQPGATANPVLQIWVRSYTPPRQGAVEVAVSLARGDKEVEVGRFTVFPSEPFSVSSAAQERGYIFDAGGALASLASTQGDLTSRVRLQPIEPGGTTDNAELAVSRAELAHRP